MNIKITKFLFSIVKLKKISYVQSLQKITDNELIFSTVLYAQKVGGLIPGQ